MAANGTQNMTELQTFLPQDGSNIKDNKYKVTVAPKDGEHKGGWDPFLERKVSHPTTDFDTLTHLLKASLGTGILAMPYAFKCSGLAMGVLCTILVSVVCTHCAYILVKCAHILYHKTRVTSMSFAEVGEVACANGPQWARKFARPMRILILTGLFACYFGTCSVYTVIIGSNFQKVIEEHTGFHMNERVYISCFLIPLIVLCWVPNLKKLSPVSLIANIFMGIGLLITLYYLCWDMHRPSDLPQVGNILELPTFFSITIFAMEAIGVIMPLENNMKTPQHFIGLCGVLNLGMAGVSMVYMLIGFMGYLKYGADTQGSITLSLPSEDILSQVVQILVALAVYCTYGLQYYVAFEIVWNPLKDKFKKNRKFYEYLVRTLLTTATVVIAVAVPTIGPFLGLIGALFFSLLGLIVPVIIEIITYWDIGFGPCKWMIFKNILLLIFGILALIFGSILSIKDIINSYDSSAEPEFDVTTGNITLSLNQ